MVHIYMVQFDSSIRIIEPALRAIRLRYTQTESAQNPIPLPAMKPTHPNTEGRSHPIGYIDLAPW
jgi:hypothetical protein